MAKTPLFSLLRRCAGIALASERTGVPADELLGAIRERHALSRRAMLGASAGTTAALLVACGDDDGPSSPSDAGPDTARPDAGPDARPDGGGVTARVAVIGAGMAGLHCAYRLMRAGVDAQLFEAGDRVGGRMFSARGMYEDGQLFELGGELIDSNHVTMMEIASSFEVELDDLFADEPPGLIRDSWFFGNRLVPDSEIVADFGPLAAVMAAEVERAESDDAHFEAVDAMSIPEWLSAQAETTPLIQAILEEAYRGEYGLEPEEQSIFNLLYLVGWDEPDPFRVFGDSDERFHVHSGNDTLTTRLAEALGERVETGARLVAIRQTAGGAYTLSFERGSSTMDMEFDHVVLALPFTLLRGVTLEIDGMSAEKSQVIAELGYGTNAKLMSQYTSRVWVDAHNRGGAAIADNGAQFTWETSRGQDGASGVLTNFLGGTIGAESGAGTAEDLMARQLPLIDAIFPGTAAAYRAGSAARMHWPTVPLALGSYACYRPGQWAFYGLEGERVGNVHFCGEHCSADFQGFMEGAAETGALAAAEVLEDLGIRSSGMMLRVLRRKLRVPQGSYLGGVPMRWMRRRRIVRRRLGLRRF